MESREWFENARHNLFVELLSAPWQGKPIWEYIRTGVLTSTPAFEGELYRQAATKIMFVGRDLNGWTEPIGDCSTLENTVHSITHQDASHAFATLVDRKGVEQMDGKKCYYHKNSRFFRLIKQVLECFGESDFDTDATWYDDSKQWQQRFVWANLYCIGPRNPDNMAASHFDSAAIKQSMDAYVRLMKLYIEFYQPDVVVFITDVPGWFVRWKRQPSFRNIVVGYSENVENVAEGVIVATGTICNSQIVVCKRPDKIGTPYEQVQAMAKTIFNYVQHLKQM